MSSFHGLSQYSQVSLFPRRPKLPCTLTFDERLRCSVTRQAFQHITPLSRPLKIILYKFRCCLVITFPSSRVPRPCVLLLRVPSPASSVPRLRVPRPSPTSQSHVPIPLLVTACPLWCHQKRKRKRRERESFSIRYFSFINDYFEVFLAFRTEKSRAFYPLPLHIHRSSLWRCNLGVSDVFKALNFQIMKSISKTAGLTYGLWSILCWNKNGVASKGDFEEKETVRFHFCVSESDQVII